MDGPFLTARTFGAMSFEDQQRYIADMIAEASDVSFIMTLSEIE